MQCALRAARRGFGRTSPNPMVGAVLASGGRVVARGYHRAAGRPHAEIEALRAAARAGLPTTGATLFVTLEPCSTVGRTPPCTDAILEAAIARVVIGTVDPNPRHRGRGLKILRAAGIEVTQGVCTEECRRLNEAFNHWIIHRTPWVTVKAALTLDGRLATQRGESKWITGERARRHAMHLRQGADAVVVGINTVLADDPALTVRASLDPDAPVAMEVQPERIVLDTMARTPLNARLLNDACGSLTTVFVGGKAPSSRVDAIARRVRVVCAPTRRGRIDLAWVFGWLGERDVTSVLCEGGGEVNAAVLFGGLAHRVALFYGPLVLAERDARPAVGGSGARRWSDMLSLREVNWRRLGGDLLLTARVTGAAPRRSAPH